MLPVMTEQELIAALAKTMRDCDWTVLADNVAECTFFEELAAHGWEDGDVACIQAALLVLVDKFDEARLAVARPLMAAFDAEELPWD